MAGHSLITNLLVCEIHPIAFESQKKESKWQQAFTWTSSVGFPRRFPQNNSGFYWTAVSGVGQAQCAVIEKHRREDPRNENATGECWVLLNSGIAVTIDTIKCDARAANEQIWLLCSVVWIGVKFVPFSPGTLVSGFVTVVFETGKFVFFLLYLIRLQSKSNEPNRTEFRSIQSSDCVRIEFDIEPNR